jgi:hypothetical protein
MIYRVAYHDRNSKETWSTGVYATSDGEARQIGAILLSRANRYNISPEQVEIIQVPGITSDVTTTT